MKKRGSRHAGPAVLEGAVAQTDTILTTFQALLRIGMLEGGAGRQRFAQVDLSELMDRLHLLYAPLAEDDGHVFIADHEAGLIVTGDAELLAQLFTNVIENAIGHTPAGTQITSRLRAEEGTVVARIADDGPGVAADELPHIFRRFFRGDASRRSAGSGLGLSLVAAIAEIHEATCAAEQLDSGLALSVTFRASGASMALSSEVRGS